MATQLHSQETPGFAYFSDTIRDLLKGHVFYMKERGYVSGAKGLERAGKNALWECRTGVRHRYRR